MEDGYSTCSMSLGNTCGKAWEPFNSLDYWFVTKGITGCEPIAMSRDAQGEVWNKGVFVPVGFRAQLCGTWKHSASSPWKVFKPGPLGCSRRLADKGLMD